MKADSIICTLCISTFNWPEALRACLETVMQQTVLPGEIIIADDGSGPETAAVINEFKTRTAIPMKHCWQPNDGFRKASIMNRAFAVASFPLIVTIDGDVLLHRFFIADHIRVAKKGRFVCGTRVLMNDILTRQIIQKAGKIQPPLFSRNIKKWYNGFRQPFCAFIHRFLQRGQQGYRYVLGCNMAIWKEDLIRVNGYNEAFTGWGKEDNDIAIRLVNAGVQLRFLKFGGIVYHMHHEKRSFDRLITNEQLHYRSISEKISYVENGMNQYFVTS